MNSLYSEQVSTIRGMDELDDAALDDLLIRWWQHRPPFRVSAAFHRECPTCRMYRTSRQYDDTNGALDDDIDYGRSVIVGRCVGCLPQPWNLAICEHAANLVAGAIVWRYNRLPEDPIAREILVVEARLMLWKDLLANGMA